jgi:transposase-like protein
MASTWGEFLDVRRRLIQEWRKEGKSCSEIARHLSMDAGQVWLINANNEDHSDVPDDARQSILEVAGKTLRLFGK